MVEVSDVDGVGEGEITRRALFDVCVSVLWWCGRGGLAVLHLVCHVLGEMYEVERGSLGG